MGTIFLAENVDDEVLFHIIVHDRANLDRPARALLWKGHKTDAPLGIGFESAAHEKRADNAADVIGLRLESQKTDALLFTLSEDGQLVPIKTDSKLQDQLLLYRLISYNPDRDQQVANAYELWKDVAWRRWVVPQLRRAPESTVRALVEAK